MIQRYLAVCESCDGKFIFRAVVPKAKGDEFVFACPLCGIRLSGSFKLDLSNQKAGIITLGFSLTATAIDTGLSKVTISTELPVHKTFHENNLAEGGSPFLWLARNMGPTFMEWKQLVDFLHEFHDKSGPSIQRLVGYASIQQWDRSRKLLAEMIDEDLKKADDRTTIYVFHKVLSSFYSLLIKFDEMVALLDEYYKHLNDCLDNHEPQYKQLLHDFESIYGFVMFRKQVYSMYLRILNNFDSFITGLLYEKISDQMRSELSEYRLYRGDYDVVKILYQDIFELNSKSMLYLGAVVNLSKRNNPCHFSSGVNSCNKFRRLRSVEKLAVLDELPLLKDFIGKVSRPMRNSIGHFSAEYEYASGDIIFEDGSNQNYIEFLGSFLWAVKSIWFLLTVIEKAELDCRKLGIK